MYKSLLPLALLLFLVVPSQAQFKFGVTAGLNISQFRVSDNDYKEYISKNRPGFLVGPTVIYNVPKIGVGFDASALFDLRGAKSRTMSGSESVCCKTLQFPLNVRYGVDFGDIAYGFVSTGPQLGLNLGDKESLIVEGTGKTTGHAMERRWVNHSSTFSWNFGVGGVVLEKVQVRLSYNLPLAKTGEIQQVDLVSGNTKTLTDGKAHAFQISLSYLL